jgi:hypothetical protein
MPKTYTVTTTDLEEKALRWAERDPQKWLDIIVHHRANIAIKELYSIELKKALADPAIGSLSSNMEEVVLASTEITAREKNNQMLNLPQLTDNATDEESQTYVETMGKINTQTVPADAPKDFLGGLV